MSSLPASGARSRLEGIVNEILLEIARHLPPQSLNALIRTNHHFCHLLIYEFRKPALDPKMVYRNLCWGVHTGAHGETSLMQFLLENGVDINIKGDHWRGTVLHQAVTVDRPKIVYFLIKNGADLEACDRAGRPPLHYATRKNIPKLLQAGANIDAADNDGYTLLHFAVAASGSRSSYEREDRLRRLDILHLLLENAKARSRNTRFGFPMHITSRHHHAGVRQVLCLLEHGANVNAVTENDHTPLHLAMHWTAVDDFVMSRLLELGTRISPSLGCPDPPSNRIWSRLELSMEEERRPFTISKLLLDRGADVKATDAFGMTALHHAAKNLQGVQVISLLLERGIDIAAQTHTGSTALQLSLGCLARGEKSCFYWEAGIELLLSKTTTEMIKAASWDGVHLKGLETFCGLRREGRWAGIKGTPGQIAEILMRCPRVAVA